MVVEADADVARAIAQRLGADGHEIESSTEGQPVLARLAAGLGDWDVVILDVGLPGSSGIEVLTRFRESGSPASVIVLTGDRSAAAATTCMRAGAFCYLPKPFEPHQLSAMVQSAARHARLRKQLDMRAAPVGPPADDADVNAPLTEAKRRASAAFERRYLVRVMARAKGSVSEGARLSGLDRTNFRRLLQRHGIEPTHYK